MMRRAAVTETLGIWVEASAEEGEDFDLGETAVLLPTVGDDPPEAAAAATTGRGGANKLSLGRVASVKEKSGE